MKVQIECDSGAEELQVLIRCRELDDQVKEIQQALSTIGKCRQQFVFYKGDTEFYMPLNEVLFMETDGNAIQVHTRDDIYQTRYKLYELEELLPGQFMRVSKSAILNTSHVYSMVLCQDLVQVKMRNFSDFNPPEAQPQCVFFYTIVRIHLVTYSYNGYEFVSYCRKLPDIRKSSSMPACNREF